MADEGPTNMNVRRVIDDLISFSGENSPPRYMKFFLVQKVAESRRFVNRMRDEAATARDCVAQLTALIAELQAMEGQEEVHDSLLAAKDAKRGEEAKLVALNDVIAEALDEIETLENNVEILDGSVEGCSTARLQPHQTSQPYTISTTPSSPTTSSSPYCHHDHIVITTHHNHHRTSSSPSSTPSPHQRTLVGGDKGDEVRVLMMEMMSRWWVVFLLLVMIGCGRGGSRVMMMSWVKMGWWRWCMVVMFGDDEGDGGSEVVDVVVVHGCSWRLEESPEVWPEKVGAPEILMGEKCVCV
ncbi:hypothetical protein Tco_0210595 [Tanacetum coccineum]